ncbi:MAG TPA: PAS domain-containing protein [Fimbriimonadaceae bacterium]|nr:PAS domain-containing protein [Fimbriimonadaceae bacterium]
MAYSLSFSTKDSESFGSERTGFRALSRREEQVLSLAAAGFLDKQIGPELGVSLNTLRTYWTRIRSKVGDGTRSALAVAYVEQLTKESEPEPDGPDWEVDLKRWVWRKLNDRLRVLPVPVGTELSMDEIFAMFHPEDEQGMRAMVAQLSSNSYTQFSYSARLLLPEGEVAANAVVRVIRDESGAPIRLLGTRIPVYAIRREETTTREALKHDGWVFDVKTGMVLASDAINRLHGLEQGKEYPRSAYGSLFFDDDYARGLRLMEEIGRGKIETGNFTLRTIASGGADQVLITVHGIRDKAGQVAKVIGYRTELRKAKLLQTPKPSTVRVGFWAMDLRSKSFIVPDEEFCKIYRVHRNSPTLDSDIRSRYLPEDRDAAYDFIEEAVAQGKVRGAHDFQLRFDDGSETWIRLEYFVESDEHGPIRMNGTVLKFG